MEVEAVELKDATCSSIGIKGEIFVAHSGKSVGVGGSDARRGSVVRYQVRTQQFWLVTVRIVRTPVPMLPRLQSAARVAYQQQHPQIQSTK